MYPGYFTHFLMLLKNGLHGLIFLLWLVGCANDEAAKPEEALVFFDDFHYLGTEDPRLSAFGWMVREGSGGPGVSGARWRKENIRFESDPEDTVNRCLILSASTRGAGEVTSQAEIHHRKTYLEGTYAARIYFTDSPVNSSPDGDQINQTFFTISPLAFDLDPDYSETDFAEYLPNGGWGQKGPTFWMTTWETYRPHPWLQDSQSDFISGSFEGWHIVSATVKNGQVKYYIDGNLQATHGGKYYPEQAMYLSFNLWFIEGGLLNNSSERTYEQRVDWVYYTDAAIEKHSEIPGLIELIRNGGTERRNDFSQ